MELREWLIILGLALVSLIVIDGIRRLKRQRRVPRLDLDQADYRHAEDSDMDPEEAKREAEINWELPNGGARVVKPADYSQNTAKPKLQRQEHPGPSRVLSEFRRHKSTLSGDELSIAESGPEEKQRPVHKDAPVECADKNADASTDASSVSHQSTETASTTFSSGGKMPGADVPPLRASESEPNVPTDQPLARMTANDEVSPDLHVSSSDLQSTDALSLQRDTATQPDTRRRQLRSSTVGDCSHEADEEDTYYQLVDFHGIKDSFRHRLHERLEEHKQRKLEKIKRKELLKAEKAKRVAEAEKREAQRAKEEAERRRAAQLQAEAARADQAAREVQASGQRNLPQGDYPAGFEHPDKHHRVDHDDTSSGADLDPATPAYGSGQHSHHDAFHHEDADEDVVRPHPTLAKAMRHDLSGRQAANTLQNAQEVIVISVMCRDEDGFEGDKLLELLMMCGLRYSSDMGIFHRLETEHPESELQFSMVNVVKPGTFPIQEMDTFLTPGVTFLMPLPGAEDSSAAFEAMVETAMVVVRHMGGELKDENRSVMTAQTIEFARQRVHEFERRHHLHRAQAN